MTEQQVFMEFMSSEKHVSYHFANHHDVWTKRFVHREDVEDPYVPQNEINNVKDSAMEQVIGDEANSKSNEKKNDTKRITDIPHFHVVNFQLLPKLCGL